MLAYMKARNMKCVDMFTHHACVDNPHEFGLNLGIFRYDPEAPEGVGEPKPIFESLMAMDTPDEAAAVEKARPLSERISLIICSIRRRSRASISTATFLETHNGNKIKPDRYRSGFYNGKITSPSGSAPRSRRAGGRFPLRRCRCRGG